jgi:two-component system chemotaxis response regulator CheY
MGFTNFVEADDGSEADRILKSTEDIGLIICDLNMPKMSGIELLKVVRSSSQYSNLPFLLVASESQKEQVVEAVKLGATNYIYKPFTGANLQDKLGRIFSSKNAS